jgi:mRNA-degrading endonuclease RelE of RelBE toxin-antitoxin system
VKAGEKTPLGDYKALRRKIKKRIKTVFDDIEKSKSLREISNIKALRGYPGFYRIRIGNYRLGFPFRRNIVALIRLLHRKEIYKFFP